MHFRCPARLAALVLVLLAAACETRSISDSGYRGGTGYGSHNPLYRGDLSEFDMLGVDREGRITDADIATALAAAKRRIALPRGTPIMLIQSGAMLPDGNMVRALESYCAVGVFSSVPDPASFSRPQGNAQVALLKWRAYKAAAGDLVERIAKR
jgi:hypothetical protein